VANIAPMLGAIMGVSKTPKGQDKKRAVKPRTEKGGKKGHRVTKGEKSLTEPFQQHGELASYKEPAPISRDHVREMKETAKGTMKRAVDDWVEGRITTQEHNSIHERGKHILEGRHPREFKGKTGERKIRGLR
jgi:hypothetical protein